MGWDCPYACPPPSSCGMTSCRQHWNRPAELLICIGTLMPLSFAVLLTARLFGGMTLYSFAFAAFLFSALPPQTAGAAPRKAFPWFYGFVIVTAGAAALLWRPHDATGAALMAAVALSTVPVRQLLMPAINRATDAGLRQRFKWLQGCPCWSPRATLVPVLGCWPTSSESQPTATHAPCRVEAHPTTSTTSATRAVWVKSSPTNASGSAPQPGRAGATDMMRSSSSATRWRTDL